MATGEASVAREVPRRLHDVTRCDQPPGLLENSSETWPPSERPCGQYSSDAYSIGGTIRRWSGRSRSWFRVVVTWTSAERPVRSDNCRGAYWSIRVERVGLGMRAYIARFHRIVCVYSGLFSARLSRVEAVGTLHMAASGRGGDARRNVRSALVEPVRGQCEKMSVSRAAGPPRVVTTSWRMRPVGGLCGFRRGRNNVVPGG